MNSFVHFGDVLNVAIFLGNNWEISIKTLEIVTLFYPVTHLFSQEHCQRFSPELMFKIIHFYVELLLMETTQH